MSTVTTPAFGSVEQIAGILRANNPDRALVDGRALGVMEVYLTWDGDAEVNLRYARNVLAAAELVRAEIRAADR
jgi:hypothetical protein